MSLIPVKSVQTTPAVVRNGSIHTRKVGLVMVSKVVVDISSDDEDDVTELVPKPVASAHPVKILISDDEDEATELVHEPVASVPSVVSSSHHSDEDIPDSFRSIDRTHDEADVPAESVAPDAPETIVPDVPVAPENVVTDAPADPVTLDVPVEIVAPDALVAPDAPVPVIGDETDRDVSPGIDANVAISETPSEREGVAEMEVVPETHPSVPVSDVPSRVDGGAEMDVVRETTIEPSVAIAPEILDVRTEDVRDPESRGTKRPAEEIPEPEKKRPTPAEPVLPERGADVVSARPDARSVPSDQCDGLYSDEETPVETENPATIDMTGPEEFMIVADPETVTEDPREEVARIQREVADISQEIIKTDASETRFHELCTEKEALELRLKDLGERLARDERNSAEIRSAVVATQIGKVVDESALEPREVTNPSPRDILRWADKIVPEVLHVPAPFECPLIAEGEEIPDTPPAEEQEIPDSPPAEEQEIPVSEPTGGDSVPKKAKRAGRNAKKTAKRAVKSDERATKIAANAQIFEAKKSTEKLYKILELTEYQFVDGEEDEVLGTCYRGYQDPSENRSILHVVRMPDGRECVALGPLTYANVYLNNIRGMLTLTASMTYIDVIKPLGVVKSSHDIKKKYVIFPKIERLIRGSIESSRSEDELHARYQLLPALRREKQLRGDSERSVEEAWLALAWLRVIHAKYGSWDDFYIDTETVHCDGRDWTRCHLMMWPDTVIPQAHVVNISGNNMSLVSSKIHSLREERHLWECMCPLEDEEGKTYPFPILLEQMMGWMGLEPTSFESERDFKKTVASDRRDILATAVEDSPFTGYAPYYNSKSSTKVPANHHLSRALTIGYLYERYADRTEWTELQRVRSKEGKPEGEAEGTAWEEARKAQRKTREDGYEFERIKKKQSIERGIATRREKEMRRAARRLAAREHSDSSSDDEKSDSVDSSREGSSEDESSDDGSSEAD